MNITPFPTLSPATIDAINVIGQWLAQDDFSGEVPYQADCVILAGNAVMPTIDAACKIARDQQIPLLISGGIGHSTTFLYSAIAQHPHYNTIRTTGRAEATILADIAHQLRTPLTSLSLILSLLENAEDQKEQRWLLWEGEKLFSQVDWLLTSLLKLSRLDAGIVDFKTEDIQVEKLLESALQPLLIPMELHHITLIKSILGNIQISGDIGWLSEAVRNILKNCMESAGDGGRIEICCRDTPLYTEIMIHDSGAGFGAGEPHHIFDRFYRGKKENASGYGIGLALSKTIVVRQGGTLTAKNHPEGGAVFTVRFPKG